MTVDVNVTKIVKYVCVTAVIIVTVIFGQMAFSDFITTLKRED